MIPSFLGLLVMGLGVACVYIGIHGAGLLDVQPSGLYNAYAGEPSTTGRNPT